MLSYTHKIIIFVLASMLFPSVVMAATLSFDPFVGSLGPGNDFSLDILLDDVEECINVIEADLAFPDEKIELKDFLVGESVFSLWVKRPQNEEIEKANESGILNFIAGVPGGYCGKIPGDPGDSNNVATLVFSVKEDYIPLNNSKINIMFLPSTKVLLNDGMGTSDSLSLKTADFSHEGEKIELNEDWQLVVDNDTTSPEPFIVELRRQDNMFDGKSYIIFNTVDKQSGIDHYEVLEIRPDEEVGVVSEPGLLEKLRGGEAKKPEWKVAKMPYLLEDQSLESIIRVKAIDKAGNERYVEYIPPEAKSQELSQSESQNLLLISLVLLSFTILLVIAIIVIRKIISNKKYDKENHL